MPAAHQAVQYEGELFIISHAQVDGGKLSTYKVTSNVCSTPALAASLTMKNAPCNLRCYGAL